MNEEIFTKLKQLNVFEKGILRRLENGETLKIPLHYEPYVKSIIRMAKKPLKGKIEYIK